MTRVLITRPHEDALALAKTLEASGITCICEPMLTIEMLTENAPALGKALQEKPNAILLTSKHGATALAAMTKERGIAVLAVGKITADTAASLGFGNVHAAGGTAHQLMEYVRTHYSAQEGLLLYACGNDVSVNIAAELAPQGYKMDAVPVYRATKATALSPQLRKALAGHSIDAAMFFSQRAAEAYVELVKHYGFEDQHRTIKALALSEGVAGRLRTLSWKEVLVAQSPDLEGMIALAKKCSL